MSFAPAFSITPAIAGALMRIESVKQAILTLPVTPRVLANLRETARLFIDAKTGLPARVEYVAPSMGGAPPSKIDETFDGFETVNGIKVPNRMTITQNGNKYAEVTVQSLKINTGLKPEDLNKKP